MVDVASMPVPEYQMMWVIVVWVAAYVGGRMVVR